MKTFSCILILCLSFALAHAQRVPKYDTRPPWVISPTTESAQGAMPEPLALKRPGHYTLGEWRQLIDSAWGPGIPTDLKLQTFDAYWDKVHRIWGGFPNLDINWDSLRNAYRPLVAAGVSRGRFAGILSRLTRALSEWHVFADDIGIDSTMGITGSDAEYPNLPTFRYKAGVPLLNFGVGFRSHFGAGITSLGDSLALVCSVMPNHPLNLGPGDIILGYDGIPWKALVRELFDAELPVLGGGPIGSTPAAVNHVIVASVGANWGLFDTIDVMKYPSNTIVHYPTALLKSIVPPYPVATEELPVNGVPFPNIKSNNLVSWGVVEGTTIGYVYAWDWFGVPDGNTSTQFGQAISDLLHTRHVTGLILDFRTNFGGWEHYANEGFKHLFNADPTGNYSRAWRVPGDNHFLFTITPAYGPDFFTPTPEIFDHPIAVLTGPNCGSAGDYNAFRLRFHPMVRFFGKPTAGAYTDLDVNPYYYSNKYLCRVDPACTYSNYNNEAYMIHKAFPVDEEVWLTRDGVARGEDDVVKRALEWINTLSYAHDVRLTQTSRDTFVITAEVQNPLGHTLRVTAFLESDLFSPRVLIAPLQDDGFHGDGAAGDNVWGYTFVPSGDARIQASFHTEDLTAGTSRMLSNAATVLFTRGAQIAVDTRSIDMGRINVASSQSDTTFMVRNIGYAADTLSVSIDPIAVPDTAVSVFPTVFTLAPGDSQKVTFRVRPNVLVPQYYYAQVIVRAKAAIGQNTFEKNYQFQIVLTSISDVAELPKVFGLEQNYPNPFNPSTIITYELPKSSDVRVSVYDLLGREVSTLVNERREAGVHHARFDGVNLSSGVYIYRLTAGDILLSKKCVIVK